MGTRNTEKRRAPLFTPEQFAHLGDGAIAYVKSMRSEDVTRLYPGAPIVRADSKEGALANAWENDLKTVSLH